MKRLQPLLALVLMLVLLVVLHTTAPAGADPAWQQKVDPWILETLRADDVAEYLVVLDEQADLSAAMTIGEKAARGAYVYERLRAVAQRSQPALVAELADRGVAYRRFWVQNMIWVRGNAATLEALAARPDVARVYGNPRVQLDTAAPLQELFSTEAAADVEWNVTLVNAPAVWLAGVKGEGVVIGGQDTGYEWEHPALIRQYRGWNGVAANHDYNWHDAIHSNNTATLPGNPCGFDSPVPCDDNGHGTHTMGTMVGDDGAGNQIGVAPEAEWIACRNMEEGWGTPASYAECYEWFVAPYPYGGDPLTDGDPAQAPHVINNSWSCPPSEGCTEPDILRQVVENVRAAGIVTVHAAGNSGPGCSSLDTPAAIYDASFSVAATDALDNVAAFSARGPVITGDNAPAKPDISAPGVGVRSAVPGGSYGMSSGTSMAAPHVAGLVGLLVSAQPSLAGDVDAIEDVIKTTALPRSSTQDCGAGAKSVPNFVYGWGRIDALAAYAALVEPPSFAFTSYTPVWLDR